MMCQTHIFIDRLIFAIRLENIYGVGNKSQKRKLPSKQCPSWLALVVLLKGSQPHLKFHTMVEIGHICRDTSWCKPVAQTFHPSMLGSVYPKLGTFVWGIKWHRMLHV